MALEFLKGKKYFKAFLVTIRAGEESYKKVVDAHHITVGRSEECDLVFPEPNISRKHLVIKANSQGEMFVEDLGSANGVQLNGEKIEPKKAVAFAPTDTISLVNTKITLQFEIHEKQFSKEILDKSALTDDQKEALNDVIMGAHQQAERIVGLAQEHSDNQKILLAKRLKTEEEQFQSALVQKQEEAERALQARLEKVEDELAKERARLEELGRKLEQEKSDFEASLTSKEQYILNTAKNKAKEEAEKVVEEANSLAEKITNETENELRIKKEDLDRFVANTLLDLERKKEKLINEGEEERRQRIEDAKKAVDDLNSENIKIAQDIIAKAKREAEETAEATKIQLLEKAEKEAQARGKEEVQKILEANKEQIYILEEKIKTLTANQQEAIKDHEKKLNLMQAQVEKEIFEKETESKHLIEKEKMELEKRQGEFDRVYTQKVKESEQELARLEKEIKHNKDSLTVVLERKKTELNALLKKHEIDLEKANHEKEKELKEKLDKDLKEKREELTDITEKLKVQEKDLEELAQNRIESLDKLEAVKADLRDFEQKLLAVEDKYKELSDKETAKKSELKLLVASYEEIEAKSAKLELNMEQESQKLVSLKKKIEVEEAKIAAELDQKKDKMWKDREQQLRNEFEMEEHKIQHYRGLWQKEISENKAKLLAQLVEQSIQYFSDSATAKQIHNAEVELRDHFNRVLDGEITASSLVVEGSKADKIKIKTGYSKYKESIHGFVAGMLVVVAALVLHHNFQNKTISSEVEKQRIERETELQARQFKPELTAEVKETYTDAVIYTRDFSELYLDEKVQERWAKQAKDYFFENWRVPEETVIEIVSKSKVLVQNLEEKKKNIHPDFVDKNIEKMREFEAEETSDMKSKLGTQVKFEAYKKLEKKFFMNEIAKRLPAQQD